MPYALQDQLVAMRRTGTPLVAITTADAPATVQALVATLAMIDREAGVVQWDIVLGLQALTRLGQQASATLAGKAAQLTNPVEMLRSAPQLAPACVLVVLNLHLFFAQPGVVQAVANLRETFKRERQCLMILCPAITLPAELRQDVLVLDEPLPDQQALERIVTAEYANYTESTGAMLPELDGMVAQATDALRGLSSFSAEQEVAMALSNKGLDVARLWRRKRQLIAQTQGLSWHDGREGFSAVGGYATLRDFLYRLITGALHVKLLVFLDEIEKDMAGARGDNTGVSQYIHKAFLTYMQDRDMVGTLLLGPAGVGKSLIAKTVGVESGVPTVLVDIGSTKDKNLGQSESNIQGVFKTIDVLRGDGTALLIATSNDIDILSPELRRRFALGGTWLVDIPTEDERLDIWQVHLARYPSLVGQNVPIDGQWTGADIAQACRLTWAMEITLTEASRYIVPVAVSAAEQVQKLRREAAGRYLDASHPGVYTLRESMAPKRQYAKH